MAYDASYDEEIAAAQRRRDRQLGNIAYERGQVQREYGFEDMSDPYNRANMLERAYGQQQRSITGNLASRGQLYSGAHLGAQEEARYGYEQNLAQTRQEYMDRLRALSEQEAGSQEEFQTAGVGARRDALSRIQEAGATPDYGPQPRAPGTPKSSLSEQEYLRRLRALRARHGANSPEVQRFRARQGR